MMEKVSLCNIERVVLVIVICILSNVTTFCSIGPISWDECGYIGQAAFMAGIDWSGVVQQFPYYSFGNGIFVHFFFRTIEDVTLLYQAILFVNSILLIGTFFLIENVIKALYPKIGIRDRIFIAFVVTIYPSNLAYSDYLIAETYITFAFWLSICALIHYLNKRKVLYLVLFEFSLIWLFFIHQRTLGACLAGIFVIMISLFGKSKSIVKYIIAIVIFGLSFYCILYYKNVAKDVLWPVETTMSNINDFDHYSMTTVELILDNIDNWAKCILGKLWYIAIATFGTAFWGLVISCKHIVKSIKDKKSGLMGLHLYIVLTMILCMGIVSVSMFWPDRIDHIIMGRYMDSLIGPTMLIGLCDIMIRDDVIKLKKFALICVGGILVVGKITEIYAIEVMQRTTWNEINSNVAIISFLSNPYERGTYAKITLLFIVLMLIVYYLLIKNRRSILIAMLLLYIPQAVVYHKGVIDAQTSVNYPLREAIEYIDKDMLDITIGYLPTNQLASQLQFMVPEVEVVPIKNQEGFNIEDYDYIFVQPNTNISDYIKESYVIIVENDVCALMIRK